ncbi:SpoIIE family protein phosphatase [Streptomyces sp. NPDC002644]
MTDAEMGPSAARDMDALGRPLAMVMRDTAASMGTVFLASPEENLLRLSVVSGGTSTLADPWLKVSMDDPAPVADAWRRRELVWLPDQQEMARRYPALGLVLPYEVMLAAVPVVGQEAWGVLSVLLPITREARLTPAELGSLRSAARALARVLDERRASGAGPLRVDVPHRVLPLQREKADREAAQAAYDVLERVPAGFCALDRDGRVAYLNPAAERMLEVDSYAALGHRPQALVPWLLDPVFEAQYRAAVLTRRATGFNASTPSGRRLGFQLFAHEAGVAIRIMDEDVPDAPALLPDRNPGEFSRAEPADIYHLTHVSARLAAAASAGDVVRLVREQVVPALGPSAFVLARVFEGRVDVLDTMGVNEAGSRHLEGLSVTADEPAARVLDDLLPRFYSSAEELLREAPRSRQVRDGMAAWAVMPLVSHARAMGCLVLGYAEPHLFTRAERSMLLALAGLVALALDRTMISDTEHRLALELQSALLPRRLPRVSGLTFAARYLPTTRGSGIGGDFYDVIRWGDGREAAVTVGDVQGHDTEAAALMGQVRTAVRATAGAPPDEVMRRANLLLVNLEAERFTSCAYAHVDLRAGEVAMANAGHVPPLLRHPDGHTEAVALPPDLLLGVEGDQTYRTRTVGLEPGAVLALYTDGLVEQSEEPLDVSIERLARKLSDADPADLDLMADDVLRHAHADGPRHDDIALLLARSDG